jgi:hypothetical protein
MAASLRLSTRREILIALVACIIGAVAMYLYTLSSTKETEKNTELLISNFHETYETQKGITESYEAILHKLSYCSVESNDASCSFDEVFTLAKDSTEIRNDLIEKLSKLDTETEAIIRNYR